MPNEACERVLAQRAGYTPCVNITASALAGIVPSEAIHPANCHLVALASIIFPFHEVVLPAPDQIHEFTKRHMAYKVRKTTRERPLWVRAEPVSARTVLRFLIRRGLILDAHTCRQMTTSLNLFPGGWKFRIMSQSFIDGNMLYFHLGMHDQTKLSEYLLEASPA